MNIAVGADHRGFAYKEYIKEIMSGITWTDVGAFTDERSDYPIFAQKLSTLIVAGQIDGGVLLCSSGVGMAIAANRYKKIYAGVAWTVEVAQACKEDDNVNVLVIPVDYVSKEDCIAIITAWHHASFKEGRYAERLEMIDRE